MATNIKVVTIPAASEYSNPFDMELYTMFAIVMPDSWTEANLRVYATHDPTTGYNGPFLPVHSDDGDPVVIVVDAGRVVSVNRYLADMAGLRWVRFRSVNVSDPDDGVSQAAQRIIRVLQKY